MNLPFKLNKIWQLTLLSVLILPLIPALGEIGLLLVLATTIGQRYQAIINSPLNWAIAFLGLGFLFSTCFAVNPQDSLLGLANLIPFLLLLAVFKEIFTNISQLRQLAWVLILPSLLIVILGWAQLFLGLKIPFLLGWELVPYGNPNGRMASVFMYANILAMYLLIVFSLTWGLWLESYLQGSKKELTLLSLYLLVQISGLFLTSSRNAWGIACVLILIFAFCLGWRTLVWLGLGIVSIIAWAAWGPEPGRGFLRNYLPSYIWARLSDEMYSDRPVAILRQTQWQFTWKLIQQRPWVGWGLRSFSTLYKQHMDVWLGHPHNLYLMLMAETGIPLTLALASLVGVILAKAIWLFRRIQTGKIILLSYLIAFSSCILFNLFDVTLFDLRVNTLSWLILSAIAGIVSHIR
jgi:O-antigen ligase